MNNKRIKERYVYDAIQLVEQWRSLYEQRCDENGKFVKYTLDQAAEIVGVPRKTLEDYYYQLKRAEKIISLDKYTMCKMGVIRKIVREYKLTDTNQFFTQEDYARKNSFEEE